MLAYCYDEDLGVAIFLSVISLYLTGTVILSGTMSVHMHNLPTCFAYSKIPAYCLRGRGKCLECIDG